MPTTSRALWLRSPEFASICEQPLDALADEQVTVRSRFGAISRGTELLVASGQVPESEFERMRAPMQEGEFPFPVKYGYAVVGEVVDGPSEKCGRTVFCLHPHQDVFTAPASMANELPPDVPPERAVLAANMETALNVVWDAAVAPGDRMAVVGGGLIGLLVGYLGGGIPGTDVTVVDIDAARREKADRLGVAFASPHECPQNCDVVVHTSATQEGLATALHAAGFEARVVEASWYGKDAPAVPLGASFHARRLSLVASQVGEVPAGRRARWDSSRRMRLALSLLDDDRLDCLFSGETRFAALAAAYHGILRAPGTLCHRIVYD